MPEEKFVRFTMSFQVKDLLHEKIIKEGMAQVLPALSGLFDELHERETGDHPLAPVAVKFKEALENYSSVVQEEAANRSEEEVANAATIEDGNVN